MDAVKSKQTEIFNEILDEAFEIYEMIKSKGFNEDQAFQLLLVLIQGTM